MATSRDRLMPNIYLLLDDNTAASIQEAAERIQAGSPFLSQLDERSGLGRAPFHVRTVGSLHRYTEDTISAAMERLAAATGPLRGRFVRWECSPATLRCTVEIEGLSEFIDAAHAELPRGRRWTTAHVTLGSCRNIDAEQRDAFLAAVEAAFPITDASVFTCTRLGYEGSAESSVEQPTATAPIAPVALSGATGGSGLTAAATKARLAARERQLQEELTSFRQGSAAGGKGSTGGKGAAGGKGATGGKGKSRLRASAPTFHPRGSAATGPSPMDTLPAGRTSTGPTGGIAKKVSRPHRRHLPSSQPPGQVAAVVCTRWRDGDWEDRQIREAKVPFKKC